MPEATHQMEAQDQQHPEPTPATAEFRHILDGAGEAILVTEVSSGRVVDANETACRWLRMAHGQLVTQHLSDLPLLSPLRFDRPAHDTFTDTRSAARPQQLDHGVVRRKDGTTFPVEITMVRRRVGDRDYVLTVARDITARGPLEEALHERDALYRGLLALSRDAVFVCSRGGLVSHANGTAARLFGYSPIEFLGLDARLLFAGADELYRFQGAVFESGTVRDLAVQMRCRDGSPIRVLLTGAVRRDSDGAVVDYQCTVRREGEGETVGSIGPGSAQQPEPESGAPETVAPPEPAVPTEPAVPQRSAAPPGPPQRAEHNAPSPSAGTAESASPPEPQPGEKPTASSTAPSARAPEPGAGAPSATMPLQEVHAPVPEEPDEPDAAPAAFEPPAGPDGPRPGEAPTATQGGPVLPPRAPITELRAELRVRDEAGAAARNEAPSILMPGQPPAPREARGHAIVRITDVGGPARPLEVPPARPPESGVGPAARSRARHAGGQLGAARRWRAPPRPGPHSRSMEPRPIFSTQAPHRPPRVPLWTATACVGAALTVVGWADLALLWFPLRFGRPEWEFATVGAHFDHMALGTVGVLLLALGVAHRGWWAPAQALAMAAQLIAIGLVAVYAIYIVAAPQAWHNVAPQLEPTIGRAVRKVSVFAVGYAAAYTWLAVYLWRKVKVAREGSG